MQWLKGNALSCDTDHENRDPNAMGDTDRKADETVIA